MLTDRLSAHVQRAVMFTPVNSPGAQEVEFSETKQVRFSGDRGRFNLKNKQTETPTWSKPALGIQRILETHNIYIYF